MRALRSIPLLVMSALVASSASGVASASTTVLAADEVVEGVRLPAGTVLHWSDMPSARQDRGEGARPLLRKAVPPMAISAWGLPIAAGEELVLGSFVSLVLARDAVVEGLPVEGGTVVEFERRRGPGDDQPAAIKVLRGCTLRRATTVQGVAFPGGTAVDFSPEGQLLRARLLDDDELLGLPVSSAADVEFHPGGRLASLRLTEPAAVGGWTCLPDAEVRVHPTGQLASCLFAEGQEVSGMQPAADLPVAFHEGGGVAGLQLAESTWRDGLMLWRGAVLRFHPNGRLRRVEAGPFDATREGPPTIRGIPLVESGNKAGDGAWFRPDGSLERVVTGAAFEYDGLPLAGGTEPVLFAPSGRLRSGRLAREVVVAGRPYPRGTNVRRLRRSVEE